MSATNQVTKTSRRSISRAVQLFGLFAGLLLTTPAWAYLDPTTGSMVISAIVGIFASIALALKTYWYKVKNLFRRGGASQAEASKAGEDTAD